MGTQGVAAMAMTAALKKSQKEKIYAALPSWIDQLRCTVTPFPATGKKLDFWTASFRCPCSEGSCQQKAYWKKDSTQDSVATEMAQKIDTMHGAHNIPQHTPSTGVYSKKAVGSGRWEPCCALHDWHHG